MRFRDNATLNFCSRPASRPSVNGLWPTGSAAALPLAGDAYWSRTAPFWADVPAAWEEVKAA
jgi:hypothetical protein